MDEARMFEPALCAVAISCHWSYPEGWSVSLAHTREGDTEFRTARYSRVATSEIRQLITDWCDTVPGLDE